ncbi:MAG: hypothetical protein V1752_07395, partial [Candidatus Firestonebacteria bacterium]
MGENLEIIKKSKTYGFVFFFLGLLTNMIVFIWSINRSASSTAAIGYLFVPFYAFIYSIPFFILGVCIYILKYWLSGNDKKISIPLVVSI